MKIQEPSPFYLEARSLYQRWLQEGINTGGVEEIRMVLCVIRELLHTAKLKNQKVFVLVGQENWDIELVSACGRYSEFIFVSEFNYLDEKRKHRFIMAWNLIFGDIISYQIKLFAISPVNYTKMELVTEVMA